MLDGMEDCCLGVVYPPEGSSDRVARMAYSGDMMVARCRDDGGMPHQDAKEYVIDIIEGSCTEDGVRPIVVWACDHSTVYRGES